MDSAAALEDYKTSLRLFALYTSLMPIELLSEAHVRSLTINLEPPDSTTAASYSADLRRPGYGYLTMDIRSLRYPYLFIHEVLGHALQNSLCKGYPDIDTAYTHFNPEGFYYTGVDGPSPVGFEGVTISDYSNISAKEDEADMLETYLGLDDTSNRYAFSPIDKKLGLLLFRLDTAAPGAMEYMDSVRMAITKINSIASSSTTYDYINNQPVTG